MIITGRQTSITRVAIERAFQKATNPVQRRTKKEEKRFIYQQLNLIFTAKVYVFHHVRKHSACGCTKYQIACMKFTHTRYLTHNIPIIKQETFFLTCYFFNIAIISYEVPVPCSTNSIWYSCMICCLSNNKCVHNVPSSSTISGSGRLSLRKQRPFK